MLLNHTYKDCTWTKKRFSVYLDNALPETERIRVHEHLKTCNSCSDELESLCGTLRMLADFDEDTMPAAIQTFRLPRSTFVEVFPTIQREEKPPITVGMMMPYLSALVLLFMVVTTWITIEKYLDTQYNESNYVEVYGN